MNAGSNEGWGKKGRRLAAYLLTVLLCGIAAYFLQGNEGSGAGLEVHFIDVGHGDATLIKCGGASMLIDTGTEASGPALCEYLKEQNISSLDYLLLTHPDKDHIGGAPYLMREFEISQVLTSYYEKDSKAYGRLMQALSEKGRQAAVPRTGEEYALGGAAFIIVGPVRKYEESNNASIALVLEYGRNRFLFTGDAEKEAEEDILENGIDISADVYHAGHHGRKGSSGKKLLEAAGAQAAVISCGKDYEEGEPHEKVLERFMERGMEVYRTDEMGTVIAYSDGEKLLWSCKPSDARKTGHRFFTR